MSSRRYVSPMPEEKKRPGVMLTPGSTLRIRSADRSEEPLVTTGIFRGYVSLGGDQALSIELTDETGEGSSGRFRFLPSSMILSVDVLNPAKPEEEKRTPEAAQVYFG
jgi:hypothetical protein